MAPGPHAFLARLTPHCAGVAESRALEHRTNLPASNASAKSLRTQADRLPKAMHVFKTGA